jgi:hypothetical protein
MRTASSAMPSWFLLVTDIYAAAYRVLYSVYGVYAADQKPSILWQACILCREING